MGPAGGVHLQAHDVTGRRVRLPGGRPGAIVFVEARGCARCVATVRAADRALRRLRSSLALTVVAVDSTTTRADVETFARSAGNPRASYLVDDRNGGLASLVGATALGRAVVYDVRGAVVGHAFREEVGEMLRRASSQG